MSETQSNGAGNGKATLEVEDIATAAGNGEAMLELTKKDFSSDQEKSFLKNRTRPARLATTPTTTL